MGWTWRWILNFGGALPKILSKLIYDQTAASHFWVGEWFMSLTQQKFGLLCFFSVAHRMEFFFCYPRFFGNFLEELSSDLNRNLGVFGWGSLFFLTLGLWIISAHFVEILQTLQIAWKTAVATWKFPWTRNLLSSQLSSCLKNMMSFAMFSRYIDVFFFRFFWCLFLLLFFLMYTFPFWCFLLLFFSRHEVSDVEKNRLRIESLVSRPTTADTQTVGKARLCWDDSSEFFRGSPDVCCQIVECHGGMKKLY